MIVIVKTGKIYKYKESLSYVQKFYKPQKYIKNVSKYKSEENCKYRYL